MDHLSSRLQQLPGAAAASSASVGGTGASSALPAPGLAGFVPDWHAFTEGCSPELVDLLASVVHGENIPDIHRGSARENAIAQAQVDKIATHCIKTGHALLLGQIFQRGAITRLSLANSPGILAKAGVLAALQTVLKQNPAVNELDLSGIGLGSDVETLRSLFPVLTGSTVQTLNLGGNGIVPFGIKAILTELLPAATHLKSLDISGSPLLTLFDYSAPSVSQLRALWQTAAQWRSGRINMLAQAMWAGECGVLSVTLGTCPHLTSLNVSGCGVNPGMLVVMAAAGGLRHLQTINLSNNPLQGDAGAYAILIAAATASTPKLASLDIEQNLTPPQTTEEALLHVTYALYKNHALQAFSYTHPAQGLGGFRVTKKMQTDHLARRGAEALVTLTNATGQWMPPEMGHHLTQTILTERVGERTAHGKLELRSGPVEGLKTLANLVEAAAQTEAQERPQAQQKKD